ncbi:metalloproteinase inhibitor 4 [Otolemur garnettii]|uniref:metalloproteinase inhibitor 4 n=1 Tax=Otolemur garnettii TaxID=30611 RepID=UPI000274180C|nr:metalloproteinase inhibitor 4 [Otolemur garnettii]
MPGSPRPAPSWALLLRLLALLRPPGLGEACSCAPAHPQQHVCRSALVIRAKISSEKVVPANTDPADTQKLLQYEIKQIKMFKGFEKVKDVQYIYTPFDSSLCGVRLEANSQKQYLLTGQIHSDGKVFIHLCNYIEPWEDLSLLQRESLNHHYHLNCGCHITTCYTVPCTNSAPNECLWTDWLLEQKLYGYQAQNYVCMKHADGTCSWYRGHLPLRKESVDIIQP